MKLALCLSGYFNSFTDLTSKGVDGFSHIQKHILRDNDVDVFIHSWDLDNKKEIEKLYGEKIKSQIFEAQLDFTKDFMENELYTINLNPSYRHPKTILSHFYSVQEAHRLMRDYEIKNSFEYDIVIKSRFDLGRINRNTSGPGLHNPYPVQCINFNNNLDMSNFYMANWQHIDSEGPADMWFYSSSRNMRNFCNLYDITKQYLKPDSEYAKSVPSEDQICNTIRLYKWFMIKTGLWDKKILLDTTWE